MRAAPDATESTIGGRPAGGWRGSGFASDVHFALRLAGRNPAFVLLTTVTLALAIGANTAVFSVARQMLYQRLDVAHPEQLRLLGWRGDASTVKFSFGTNFDARAAGMTCDRFSWAVFRQLEQSDHTLAGLFAFMDRRGTAWMGGSAVPVQVEMVSDGYYRVLGVRPQLGRPIGEGDGDAVALISDGLWARAFGRSPTVIGKTVTLEHVALTIVGVNPRGFTGAADTLQSPDLFVPLALQPRVFPMIAEAPSLLTDASSWMLDVMGRMRQGQNERRVQAALDVELGAAVRSSLTVRPYETVPRLVMVDGARGLHRGDATFRKPVNALRVLVALVLLLACANIANLMLARGVRRRREMAVRVALGASRGRLVRQLLTESLLLAAAGGGGGLLLGFLGRNALPHLLASAGAGPETPFAIHFTWSVWLFSAGVTMLTGVLFGLAPALGAARTEARAGLLRAAAHGARSGGRGGQALVVLQIGLSALLVMGAGLLVRTVTALGGTDLGFRADHLFLATIRTPREGYAGSRSVQLHERLQAAIARVPGVEAATSNEMSWLNGNSATNSFHTEENILHPGGAADERENVVENHFFQVMGIPIVAGRGFTDSDTAAATKVGIVNEALARSRFPGEDPVGKRFTMSEHPRAMDWIEIVGVAADTKYEDLRETPPPQFFLPVLQQESLFEMTYEIRSHLEPQVLLAELRRSVAGVDGHVTIANFETQWQQIEDDTRSERALADLTSGFGLVALALAITGVYGVMLCAVEQRRKEMGIRLAVGAERRQVRNLILRDSAGLAVLGIAGGLAVSQALTRLLQAMVYDISPHNVLLLAGVAALLLLVTLAAAWIPARRAASVALMEVLRQE